MQPLGEPSLTLPSGSPPSGSSRRKRTIRGLRWVRPAATAPHPPPSPRRGAKLKGIQWENRVARELQSVWGPKCLHGQWLEFEDSNGRGYAQPDFILQGQDHVLCVEAKLSWIEAERQVLGLYAPLLRELYELPVRSVVVVKYLRPGLDLSLLVPWNEGSPAVPSGGGLYIAHKGRA